MHALINETQGIYTLGGLYLDDLLAGKPQKQTKHTTNV